MISQLRMRQPAASRQSRDTTSSPKNSQTKERDMNSQEFQSLWVEKPWIIRWANPADSGTQPGDVVRFTETPSLTVQILHADSSTETWDATIDGDDLVGVRSSDSRPFR